MVLQEILFGTWQKPVVTKTTVHRIGLTIGAQRYIPPKPRVIKEKQASESNMIIMEIMKKAKKPMSPMDMEKVTPWTRNHCGMKMCELFKQGLLKRHKVKAGNTRHYIYEYVKATQ